MARHVDDVVRAAEDEIVAVLVADAPVEGRVRLLPRHALPVGRDEALVVAPDGGHAARRQRTADGDHALGVGADLFSRHGVVQAHVVAVDRHAGRAEPSRQRLDAALDREDRPAGLGLPVVVDDRLADALGDPARGRFVERFAGEEQQAQRREVVLAQQRGVLFLQHADRGRCGEHDRHAILLDDLPPDAAVGADRRALVEDRRHAGDQRAIDDVAVPDHPPDVARGEKGLALVAAVDQLHGRGECDRVAAGVALHALGLAGGAAGVEDVARLGALEPRAGHLIVEVRVAQRRVVHVAAGNPGHRCQPAVDEQHRGGRRLRQADRLVEQALVGHGLAAARARVRAHDHLRRRVVDACGEAHRGEPAEHHRVDRTDARARQHGEHRFRDHRHVDQHAIAAADAERAEHRRHAVHFAVQLAERVGRVLTGLGRDVDQGRGVAQFVEVPVDGVVAEVGAAADEPLRERRPRMVQHLGERHMPVDERRLLAPERRRISDRSLVELLVARHRA